LKKITGKGEKEEGRKGGPQREHDSNRGTGGRGKQEIRHGPRTPRTKKGVVNRSDAKKNPRGH